MSDDNLQGALHNDIKDLIRLETRCLNAADLETWSSLFTEDGYYWMPLERTQTDPEQHDSLIYDNRALMAMRRYNLHNPLSPSMQREVRSVRILSEPDIDLSAAPGGDIIVRADVIAVIHHRKQDTFAGTVTWRLVRTDAGLKIKSKRVDLLNADAPLDSIMMYI
ncbi:MAG: nuclear transport factor 2 family protein [Gammaproteobacteria bacterium]|nr:nuclear transport factor 2 family protein [Gammaproteobacteria bacterium]